MAAGPGISNIMEMIAAAGTTGTREHPTACYGIDGKGNCLVPDRQFPGADCGVDVTHGLTQREVKRHAVPHDAKAPKLERIKARV